MATTSSDQLEAYLAPFGLTSFRSGQRAVIETVMAGKDCLCIMPTGGGKSLCYQLPAIARSGVTLVISPLIALMKDQVDQLTARGLPATFINSTLSPQEQTERLEGMARGAYRLVYVVPERFRSPRFVEAARQCELTLLAVDEAHCVSEWGHDFRPDYARLGRFRAQLGNPPTIALTATATDAVRRDVVELLQLDNPQVFITGFERPNLYYRVQAATSDRDKDDTLFRFLGENAGAGIVYASTRKRCEELAARIAETTRRSTTVYHAGMAADDRRAAQESFMQGRAEIAVATLAFGMGIDKSDVRFVVHYNLPGSLEAYYQEAGRAGRDGQPAQCLLLFGGADRRIHEFFIESAYPSRDVVREVYNFLCGLDQSPIEMTQQEVKETLGLQIGHEGVGACEKLLESAGAIERLETTDNAAAVRLATDLPTLVDLVPRTATVKRKILRALENHVGDKRHDWCDFQPRVLLRELTELDSTTLSRHLRDLAESLDVVEYVPPFRGRAIHLRDRQRPFEDLSIDFELLERQKASEYERLDRVTRFARSSHCRQKQILEYFGQEDAEDCQHCDNCDPASSGAKSTEYVVPNDALLEAVRVVLSGVARTTRTRAGVGKNLLAQMLRGKVNKQITRNRLDKLSTFGLLAHWKQPEVVELVDALAVCGLVEQTEFEPFRPIVQLTPRGSEVMSGHTNRLPTLPLTDAVVRRLGGSPAPAAPSSTSAGNAASPAADAQPDRDVVSRLRAWRDSVSREASIPAYMVLTNGVIDELARARPRTVRDLLAVKGIGSSKAERYGGVLLELVASAADSRPRTEEPASTPSALAPIDELPVAAAQPDVEMPIDSSSDAELERPSHYWTWRLLSAGFTPEECAAIRSLSAEVVLDHALRASDSGLAIEPPWFLAPELIASIERALERGDPTRIRQLLVDLPRGTRYEEVQLVLKARPRA